LEEQVLQPITPKPRRVSAVRPLHRWRPGGAFARGRPRLAVISRQGELHRLHNTGIAWRDGKFIDMGAGQGNFKTPTLREVARTAPYMHDGSIASLEDVIEYYDRGGNRNPYLDAELHPLHLSVAEKQNLIAFLGVLNGHEIGR
jgi:cytochrome c peroxidase